MVKVDSTTICKVAVKILYTDDDKEQKRALATQMALEKVCQAYTTARQEVSILQTVHHPHIVPLLGFSRRPLALLLALAPMGSLQDLLEKRHKEGLRLPVFVIKQVVIQVADALDYLHKRSIIYRDLKSDNVLVWHFPKSSDNDPKQMVTVKLADYGISRSVMPAGAKGYGGTPPFIAPEILVHAGRDIYTEQVDIFSFGMFMFELLTCRAPLADINNPAVHVCNGGRPNITSKEANYPSHFLDLMSVCWDQDPQCRPTAAQIRMIASCPQFCHLADAVSMETQAVVLSVCSVTQDSHADESLSHEDQCQIWMATQVGIDSRNTQYNVEVFHYNKKCKFVSAQELKQDNRIIGVCAVSQAVWCLDKTGTVHEYNTTTFEKTNSLTLVQNNIEDLKAMFHYSGSGGGHVVLLFQQEDLRRVTRVATLFHLPEDVMVSKVKVEPVEIVEKCFCAAAVETKAGSKLWIGTTNGSVLVKSPENWDRDEGPLNPYTGPVDSSELICMFIVSSSSRDLQNFAWTYNYQGSKVFCWDVNQHSVVSILDCANIIPAVDSHKINKHKRFEANHYQVTAMNVIDKYLYVSTTWGCVIVADAASLRPYSAFRCHGNEDFYCKAILPLGPIHRVKELYNRNPSNHDDSSSECRGVVTVGRGYVDLINHVTNLEKQALVRGDAENGWSLVDTGSVKSSQPMKTPVSSHTHVLSWLTEQWENY